MAHGALAVVIVAGLIGVIDRCGPQPSGGEAEPRLATEVSVSDDHLDNCPASSQTELMAVGDDIEVTRLRAALRRGPVLLSVTDCGARVVDTCRLGGATLERAVLPVREPSSRATPIDQFAWLSSAAAAVVQLDTIVSGEYRTVTTGQLELQGVCDAVTHYATRVEFGAFKVWAKDAKLVLHAGAPECCDTQDRVACDVPLRLELAPIAAGYDDRSSGSVAPEPTLTPARFREPVFIASGVGHPEFALDRVEVTQEAYRACTDAGVCRSKDSSRGSTPATLDRCAAEAFCGWVGGRLPSRAEWLWAARGREHDRRYPWGDYPPSARLAAWNCDGQAYGFVGPLPVGSLPAGASSDGLLDMAGNVSEWVIDENGRAVGIGGDWNTDSLDYLNVHEVDASGARCAYPAQGRSSGAKRDQ